MEYRILGPLEVVRDGVPVVVKGRHQPRLLAVLLLEAGRTVTVSRLVEALWEDEPPETARRQVQNYMAALRRSLGAESIASVGEGYRLVATGAVVDGLRFDELVRVARDNARTGRHAAALAGLDQALGLWRGPVLAGLTGRFVEAAVARWNEKRLAAVEERVELRLALGRHADVVDELREVLRETPFRQRATGQLMLALYRCGRAAEALEVFDGLRERLAEELGIDPDIEVRELRERISREDGSLREVKSGSAGKAAKSEIPVPAQLPRGMATFIARGPQLAKLDELLDHSGDTSALSIVTGGGGVGKTALAVHWSRRHRAAFPDGQLFVDLRGYDHGAPVESFEVLSRFLRALGISGTGIPSDLDDAAALYRSRLVGKRALLLLDNARTAEQVRPLLPGEAGSVVLVTSRSRLADLSASAEAMQLSLGTLAQSDGIELLSSVVGEGRLRNCPDAARRLADLCGGLPLALRIAGANLSTSPNTDPADFADLMESNRLDSLALDGDPLAGVAITFDHSFASLTEADQRLLLRLGLIPGVDFGAELASTVADLTQDAVEQALARLETAHLIEQYRAGRYRFHDLVRAYVRQRGDGELGESSSEEVRERCIDWYCAVSAESGREELANVVSAFKMWRAYANGWRLAIKLGDYVSHGFSMSELRRLVETELERVERLGDKDALAQLYNTVAKLCREAGDDEAAIEFGRRAVSAIAETPRGDHDGKYRGNLAIFLQEAGHFGEATGPARDALRAAREAANPAHIEVCTTILAMMSRDMGEYDAASELLRSLLEGQGGSFDSAIGQSTRLQLALLHLNKGDYETASQLFSEFEQAYQNTDLTRNSLALLQDRAQLDHCLGRYAEARVKLLKALAMATATNRLSGVRDCEISLAELFVDLGELEVAHQHLASVRDTRVAPLSLRHRVECLRIECLIQVRGRNFESAIATGREASALYVSMPMWHKQARTLTVLAEAHTGLGHHSQAEECLREALVIFTRIGVPEGEPLKAKLDARPR